MKKYLSKLQELMPDIPGGMVQCLKDDHYTILYMNEHFISMLGYTEEEIREKFNDKLLNLIHPDDRPFVEEGLGHLTSSDIADYEYRIITRSGVWSWVLHKAKICLLPNGHEAFCSIIIDINNRKWSEVQQIQSLISQKEELLRLVEQDALTGLFNKTAAKKRVEHFLSTSGTVGTGALVLLDLDNFKTINDSFGHLCGDAVLTDTAGILKRTFRTSDICARIGGDEFLVFLPGISRQNAVSKISHTIKTIHQIVLPDHQHKLSVSAGISCFPGDASSFNELYQKADLALYHTKNNEKGGITTYTFCLDSFKHSPSFLNTRTTIDSESISTIDEKLAKYSFQMLYRSKDIPASVRHFLEIVGNSYDVSRVYIFENSEDGRTCSNTFEWCNHNISSQMDKFQCLSYENDLIEYQELFDESGIFYCRDVSQLKPHLAKLYKNQGICSLLQCTIMDGTEYKGFVGFDEHQRNRYWTDDQIRSLSLVANVLSAFLLKYRLKEQLRLIRAGQEQKNG